MLSGQTSPATSELLAAPSRVGKSWLIFLLPVRLGHRFSHRELNHCFYEFRHNSVARNAQQ